MSVDNRYLFRGYTIEGVRPHFVTGHYVSVPRPMIVSDKPKIGGGWDFDDVDPATVGQCTGLRATKSYRGESEADKLIFEGDVVSCITDEDEPEIYRVAFENFRRELRNPAYSHQELADFANDYTTLEIIDTIYDRMEENKCL